MSQDQDILQGEHAQRFLNDETFVGVMAGIKNDLLLRIANSAAGDTASREQAYFEIRGIDAILLKLKAMADNGHYARHQREKA